MEEFIVEYWTQLVAVVFVIFSIAKIIETLKGSIGKNSDAIKVVEEKVKVLFELWNSKFSGK